MPRSIFEFLTNLHEVAVSPNRQCAAITNYGSEQPENSITLVDLKKQNGAKTIDLESHRRPRATPFVANSNTNHIAVIDTGS